MQKQCHPGAVCETWNDVALSRVAVCVCLPLHDLEASGKCQLTTGEVCASDGNIYANTCYMLRTSCLQQTELRIVSWTAVNQKDCQQQASKRTHCNYASLVQVLLHSFTVSDHLFVGHIL